MRPGRERHGLTCGGTWWLSGHYPDTRGVEAPCPSGSIGYSREEIAHEKQHVGWPLREPPHEPGKPVRSIADEHSHLVSGPGQPHLFRFLKSVEHLKFEFFLVYPFKGSLGNETIYQAAIVGGEGGPDTISPV